MATSTESLGTFKAKDSTGKRLTIHAFQEYVHTQGDSKTGQVTKTPNLKIYKTHDGRMVTLDQSQSDQKRFAIVGAQSIPIVWCDAKGQQLLASA